MTNTKNLKLYKVYLVGGKKVILNLLWAENVNHVYDLLDWTKKDKPKPIIKEISIEEGVFLSHHIADSKFL